MNNLTENSNILLLLMQLLSKLIFSGGGAEFIANMDTDTLELLYRKAEDNRLGKLLYYYCVRDKVLPVQWADKWAADFRTASAAELFRAEELRKVYKIMADNGIEAAPLKGICLAYGYYPHPALRDMCDFDILIRPESVRKAFQLLLDNGFTADLDFGNPCHEAQLRSARGFVVELHTHISPEPDRCPYEALWRNCRESAFRGQTIISLAPEISLLHAVNHVFRNDFACGLRSFIDAAYILAGTDLGLEQLENCAEANGFYNEFKLFMNIFPEYFPEKYFPGIGQIPPGLLEDARYLVSSFKYIQDIDRHDLMLYREYQGLSLTGRLLFLVKKLHTKPASLAKIYNCRIHSPMLVYYYLHRTYTYFSKFVTFGKKSRADSLSRRIGICQRMINSYLGSME